MPGHYDPVLVLLSFAIAVLASWVALDLSSRVHQQQRSDRRWLWLMAGSVSMGTGIWAMHFVGMQAYRMPMRVLYDWPTVAISIVAAVVASGVAFLTITRPRLTWVNTGLSGTVMGGGIASMHYLGMAAMRMRAEVRYTPSLVVLSVLVAVVISMTALRLTFGLRDVAPGWSGKKAYCALLMGGAIPTMHYLGMAAAHWTPMVGGFGPEALRHAVALSPLRVVLIVLGAIGVLSFTLLFAKVDREVSGFESALHGSQHSYEQLINHHERLQGAYRAGGVGIWECDPATQMFYVDASLRELYGLEDDGLPVPRAAWRARVHPEDAAALDARWAASQAAGETYESKYRVVHLGGEIRWVRSVASLVRSETGAVVRVLGMTWDRTSEHLREQEIADEAERFRRTLESIGDAVVSTDERQRIIFLNRAARTLTGWSMEEAEGKPLWEVLLVRDERTDAPWLDPVRGCLEGGGTLPLEHGVLVGRNGTRHNIRGHIALINESGAAVLTFQDVTGSRRMEQDLQYAATHDAVTGLLNRTAFERQLQEVWAATRGSARTHCLCIVDLDRFKIINDTSGHLAGDALLREIADVLEQGLAPADFLARMGGDEFLLLLVGCPREEGEARVRRMLDKIRALQFPWHGRLYDVTASSGLVVLDGVSQEPAVLVSQADVATFTAKRNGRNQVSVYTGDGGAADAHQEMEVVAGLRRSLEQDRFELYAQPIVPIDDPGLAHHFELLIRMRDENGELLSPALFVPAAERYGLMGMVDRWVIRAALGWFRNQSLQDSSVSFAVNLSAESLNDASLWAFVAEQLQKTKVPPDRITFEVTETGLIGNFDHARAFVNEARRAGCRIALDDFGTGLSSLSYLKQFALDVIKIDGGFIRTLRDNPLDQAIIRSIAEIARSMEASTVAECVEDVGMLQILRGLGVDYAQGWATGRPKPIGEVLAAMTAAA